MPLEVHHSHSISFDSATQRSISSLADSIGQMAKAINQASAGVSADESNQVSSLRDLRDRVEAVHRVVESLAISVSAITNQESQFMPTLQAMQAKIDEINANTTASSQAAGTLNSILQDVRDQLAALKLAQNGNMSAEEEQTLFNKLDAAVQTTAALRTNLEQTASNPTSPEPPPVVVPPIDNTGGGGTTDTGSTGGTEPPTGGGAEAPTV